MPGKDKELSREEDYRDFEERNIDDGWPYADKGQTGADSANGAYGEASGREPNSGFRVDGVDEDGNENPLRDSLRPGLIDRDDSDELEAKVAENLENIPDVDVGGIEVHADGQPSKERSKQSEWPGKPSSQRLRSRACIMSVTRSKQPGSTRIFPLTIDTTAVELVIACPCQSLEWTPFTRRS
ncbi:hypothetical protein FHT77_002691 [Rhizobium sp. BK181]|nr:hypothetical protein [Rhizobium sp. BK181]